MRHLFIALVFVASCSLSAQVRPFTAEGKRFQMVMPSPNPARTITSFAEGRVSVHGESYVSQAGTTRVVASFWQLSEGFSENTITAFVQSLERSFPQSSKLALEAPPHNRHASNVDGEYLTMSSDNTMIGLWISVQGKGTIYTVSFSCPKEKFAGAESTYLNSFAVILN